MSDERLTIGEMCRAFGVTPRTLRYYEYIELISPEREGQKRLYTARDRGRLTLILRGRRFGFSLEEIRRWLTLYEAGDNQREQIEVWVAAAERRLGEMREEIRELEDRLEELERLRDEGRAWLRGQAGPS
ncbi:MAG: MerR family DNA-binding transcriptional regulator [Alphaproteobacteria bacterium]|nr:MAG: MerR family DNA-binding transcriptional regulator [Alphaproteobacteria bacterium]